MIVWTTKGTTNAEQEAQAGRDYRQLREVEIVLAQGASTAKACRRIVASAQAPPSREQALFRWRKE
jgi:hypothetical protein